MTVLILPPESVPFDPVDAGADHATPPDLLALHEGIEFSTLPALVPDGHPFLAGKPLTVVAPITGSAAPIVTREGWGARRPGGVSTRISPQNGGVAWHYEGPEMGDYAHERCPSLVRGIQAFHMDGRGWSDVAYSAIVCRHGTVYLCRWVGVRTAAQGTNDGNDRYYAVCYLAGAGDPLTDAAKRGMLYATFLLRRDGRAAADVEPHSHFHSTACPGDPVRAWISASYPTPGGGPMPTPPQETRKMVVCYAFTPLAAVLGAIPNLFGPTSAPLYLAPFQQSGPDPHALGPGSFGLGTSLPAFKQYRGTDDAQTLRQAMRGEGVCAAP